MKNTIPKDGRAGSRKQCKLPLWILFEWICKTSELSWILPFIFAEILLLHDNIDQSRINSVIKVFRRMNECEIAPSVYHYLVG